MGVMCSALWSEAHSGCCVEGGPWRAQRGEKETNWQFAPETQMGVVSWSRAVMRDGETSAWVQTIFWKKNCQDLLID